MKFSACDAPSIVLRRASRVGFLAHLSARERQVWDAFRSDDGTCYLRFAPTGGPILWMREESERPRARLAEGQAVVGAIAPPARPLPATRMPRPLPRTVLVGRFGSRTLFVFAGTRAR